MKQSENNKLSATPMLILGLFADKPELTVAEIVELTGKNIETVRKTVQSLANKGYLKKQGTTKGVFYILNK